MDTINCGSCIDNLWTHCIFLNGKQNTFKELKKKKTTRTHSLPDDKYTLYGNFTENHQFMVEDEIQGQNPSISLIKRKLHFASHCNVFQTRHKMTPPIIVFFQMTDTYFVHEVQHHTSTFLKMLIVTTTLGVMANIRIIKTFWSSAWKTLN